MRGVVVPEREADFTADPVELFFDLAFVFAFSRLVFHLVHHPDWTGIGEFALLFLLIWLPWTQFTWSANAVSGNQRPVRLLFLVATVASVPMAGTVTDALSDSGLPFAISVSVILAMGLFIMIFGLDRDDAVRSSIVAYSIPNWIAIALVVGGGVAPREARIVLWIAALAVVVYGTIRAGSNEWIVRPGHFAERHGLIIIVALGEIIVALGVPVVEGAEGGEGLPVRTILALVAAGAFAGLMWWACFDRPIRALEHRHGQLDAIGSGRFARDVYTYGFMPIVAGIILCAAALEEVTLHPKDALPEAFRWMLIGGLALTLGGVAIAVGRAFRVIARERLYAAAVLAVVVLLAGELDALVLLLVVDVVLLAMLAFEHVRVEGRPGTRSTAATSG